jgi:hypothetical protein
MQRRPPPPPLHPIDDLRIGIDEKRVARKDEQQRKTTIDIVHADTPVSLRFRDLERERKQLAESLDGFLDGLMDTPEPLSDALSGPGAPGAPEPPLTRDFVLGPARSIAAQRQELEAKLDAETELIARCDPYYAERAGDAVAGSALLSRTTGAHCLKPELDSMMRVLASLGFITPQEQLTEKGRCAAFINTVDEVLVTELIFARFFGPDVTPARVAATMSALLYEEKEDKSNKTLLEGVDKELALDVDALRKTAKAVGRVSLEARVPNASESSYMAKVRPRICPLIYYWAEGQTFGNITSMDSDIFEGNLVRIVRRLAELLRQLADAARAIGNDELQHKFEQAVEKVKRGIMFTTSLYLA